MCKTCSKCNITYDDVESNFYKRPKNSDGFDGTCRKCSFEIQRKYLKNNKDKVVEYLKKNREKILEQRKKYYKNNREKALEKQRKHYENNREKVIVRMKKWRQENKDEHSLKNFMKRNGLKKELVDQNTCNVITTILKTKRVLIKKVNN